MRGWFKQIFGAAEPPCVPLGQRLYAVGDVHGRLDLLDQLLTKITQDKAPNIQSTLIFLGDYVDRGADSAGVIARLSQLQLPGWRLIFLRGNHDQTLLDFLSDAGLYRMWRNHGAAETLVSYGVMPPRFETDSEFEAARLSLAHAMPEDHLSFLTTLANYHTEGDYVFVHAGVRPGVALERQDVNDLMWIRDPFLSFERPLRNKVVVHGHTPLSRPVRGGGRIGIDTGAYVTGVLTAVVLEGLDCRFISTDDTMLV